jgi:hypothetical protein
MAEDRIGPSPDIFDADDPFSPYPVDRVPCDGRPNHTYVLRRAPQCDATPIPAADVAVCAVLRGNSSSQSRGKFFPCIVDGKKGTCLNLQDTSGERWWGRWFRNIGWAGRLDGTGVGLAASGFLAWGLPFGVGGRPVCSPRCRPAAMLPAVEPSESLTFEPAPGLSTRLGIRRRRVQSWEGHFWVARPLP